MDTRPDVRFVGNEIFPSFRKNDSKPVLPDILNSAIPKNVEKAWRREFIKALLNLSADPQILASLTDSITGFFKHFAGSQHSTETKYLTNIVNYKGMSPEKLKKNLALFSFVDNPEKFLNSFLLNRDEIVPETLTVFYDAVDYGRFHPNLGPKLVPEIMATMPFYSKILKEEAEESETAVNSKEASTPIAALTYIYEHNAAGVYHTHPMTYANWGRLGILSLSFKKWKYDAQSLLGGKSLFERSGLFVKVPFQVGPGIIKPAFTYHNPTNGLKITLTRNDIRISQPPHGSLIIQNMSPALGRSNKPEVASYRRDSSEPYLPILSPGLCISSYSDDTMAVQAENQTHIAELISQFQAVMSRYKQWKYGFDGKSAKVPPGFLDMMKISLASQNGNGPDQLNLAWVNPKGLPAPVRVFDISDPGNKEQLAFYRDAQILNPYFYSKDDYQQQMPDVIAFRNFGLRNGLELILTNSISNK